MSEEPTKTRRGRPPAAGAVAGTKKKKEAKPPTELAVPESVEDMESPPVAADGVHIDYGFHFLDTQEDYGEGFQQALESVAAARKNQTIGFKKMSEIQESFAFPFRHFLLQYAVGQFGVPSKKIIDIIGAEGIGKSTLVMNMLGGAMDVGCPAMYVECESKLISPARAMRALHSDMARAYKMLSRLRIESVNSLDHMWQVIKDFVYVARGTKGSKDTPRVPMHVPLVIAVDPWSKLLNPDEAAGFYNYGDNMSDAKKKKFKEVNEGSNLGHAKWAHRWCRLLPAFLKQFNVVLIIVHHQNDKIEMGGGGAASYMSPEASALYNKTRIGGKALHQNTALTLILSRKGLSKNSAQEVTGNLISCRVAKNSLGHDNVKFFYELRTSHFHDTITRLDHALNFNIGFATMCAEQKWLSTTVKGSRFTSSVLGVTEVSADQFYEAFEAATEQRMDLGRKLGINGYVNIVDNIKQNLELSYHAEHKDSIESDVVVEQPSPEEMERLRAAMDKDNAQFIDVEAVSVDTEAHLESVLHDIDESQESEIETTNE